MSSACTACSVMKSPDIARYRPQFCRRNSGSESSASTEPGPPAWLNASPADQLADIPVQHPLGRLAEKRVRPRLEIDQHHEALLRRLAPRLGERQAARHVDRDRLGHEHMLARRHAVRGVLRDAGTAGSRSPPRPVSPSSIRRAPDRVENRRSAATRNCSPNRCDLAPRNNPRRRRTGTVRSSRTAARSSVPRPPQPIMPSSIFEFCSVPSATAGRMI